MCMCVGGGGTRSLCTVVDLICVSQVTLTHEAVIIFPVSDTVVVLKSQMSEDQTVASTVYVLRRPNPFVK